jgi:hypothetical protein
VQNTSYCGVWRGDLQSPLFPARGAFWITIFIVSILTVCEITLRIKDNEAKFHPVGDIERVNVINPSYQEPIIYGVRGMYGSWPGRHERSGRRISRSEHFGNRVVVFNGYYFPRLISKLSHQELVLRKPNERFGLASYPRPVWTISDTHYNVSGNSLPDIFWEKIVTVDCSEDGHRRFQNGWPNWLKFNPCPFIRPKKLLGILHILGGICGGRLSESGLLLHLAESGIHGHPLFSSEIESANQKQESQARDPYGDPYGQSITSDIDVKWRFPLAAGGFVMALVFAVLRFSLINASDGVKRKSIANLLKVATGILCIGLACIAVQAALDILDLGRVYL